MKLIIVVIAVLLLAACVQFVKGVVAGGTRKTLMNFSILQYDTRIPSKHLFVRNRTQRSLKSSET